MINTTKINTEYNYKVTDALLQAGYMYKQVNNNVCYYIKDNVSFMREKIPYRHIYIYKFTEFHDNIVYKEYTKKSEVKKLVLKLLENSL